VTWVEIAGFEPAALFVPPHRQGKTKTEIMHYIACKVFPHLLATASAQASDNREPVRAGLPA
jgi:hypothetical protein